MTDTSQSSGSEVERLRTAVLAELDRRIHTADLYRRSSGGSADDPYTGDPWQRAQLVQLREFRQWLEGFNV